MAWKELVAVVTNPHIARSYYLIRCGLPPSKAHRKQAPGRRNVATRCEMQTAAFEQDVCPINHSPTTWSIDESFKILPSLFHRGEDMVNVTIFSLITFYLMF